MRFIYLAAVSLFLNIPIYAEAIDYSDNSDLNVSIRKGEVNFEVIKSKLNYKAGTLDGTPSGSKVRIIRSTNGYGRTPLPYTIFAKTGDDKNTKIVEITPAVSALPIDINNSKFHSGYQLQSMSTRLRPDGSVEGSTTCLSSTMTEGELNWMAVWKGGCLYADQRSCDLLRSFTAGQAATKRAENLVDEKCLKQLDTVSQALEALQKLPDDYKQTAARERKNLEAETARNYRFNIALLNYWEFENQIKESKIDDLRKGLLMARLQSDQLSNLLKQCNKYFPTRPAPASHKAPFEATK